MLELSADDDVYTFKHAGTEYTIPALTVDDVVPIGELIALPHAQMTAAARDYISGLCADEHPETAELIRKVGLKNFFLIFRTWSGMSLGESKPSDDS